MAQFDVHRLRNRMFVVDVQSDVIGSFNTRLIIPLVPRIDEPEMHPRLHPVIRSSGSFGPTICWPHIS